MNHQTDPDRSGELGRRGFIKTTAGAAGLSLWAGVGASVAFGQPDPAPQRNAKRVLRLAHMTDTHVQPERAGDEGFAACLKHAHSLDDPPTFILFGGDNVMNVDSKGNTGERADQLIDVWNATLKAHCKLPHTTCIGNHDILGLEQDAGKAWAVKQFGLEDKYFGFDRAGWRFIVLDSTTPLDTGGYKARLDDDQFAWLQQELEQTPADRPVLVLSHIPIITVTSFFDGNNEKTGNWVVPGSWMHIDARRIKDLFHKHKNVKLCLSGHEHLVDQVTYNGVTYCCNGAVSGAWWKGNYHECAPGYGVTDLYEDGSFHNQYVVYGWQPKP
ncbi:MAG: metallophosphoesterase family protein [Phycisphaeraceae bacterium]